MAFMRCHRCDCRGHGERGFQAAAWRMIADMDINAT
jgi:hypothetical protein